MGLTLRLPKALAWRPRPDRDTARLAVEALLVAVIGVEAAALFWTVAAPANPIVEAGAPVAGPADVSILSRFDPFFRGGATPVVEVAGEAVEAAASFRLFGVTRGAGGGSAILAGPDGRQQSVVVGAEAAPGVVLASVASDHVMLRRGGSEERIDFAPADAAPPPPPPPQAGLTILPATAPAATASVAAGSVDAERLMRETALQPSRRGGRIEGYAVLPRGDGAAMRAAGLRPGDVVTAVNGVALNTPERAAELGADLRNLDQATLTVTRDGRPTEVAVSLKGDR